MSHQRFGFVKINRSIQEESWIWNDKPFNNFAAWAYLILNAKFKDDVEPFGKDLIKLKRGQLLTSQLKLAEIWGWHRDSVKRFLTLLQSAGKVTFGGNNEGNNTLYNKGNNVGNNRGNNRFTIITICKYDDYAGLKNGDTTTDTTTQATQSAQPRQQQNGTVIEYKEDNILTTLVPTKNGDDTVSDSKPQTKPAKKSEVEKKGSPEWYVKSDAIYLANTANMHLMPIKADIIQQIFSKTIAARPDKATAAFISTNPPIASNFKKYSAMLVFYGIAKTFHMLVCTIRPIEGYKVMRTTNVEKAINHARLLVQDDKQPPEKIKDVMDWMFDEKQDPFWRNTVMSIDGFRRHFDKIVAKMEDSIRAREEKIVKPGFTLNHHGTGHED